MGRYVARTVCNQFSILDLENTSGQGNMYDLVRGVLPLPLIWMILHALHTLHKYRFLEAH